MTMPDELVLVRHGQSVGNVAHQAERKGDLSRFTDEFMTTPGHRWVLTETGIAQARCAGAWLRAEFVAPTESHFDRYYVSPYRRTRETAKHLDLFAYRATDDGGFPDDPVSAKWLFNRALRERDWGDIGSMSRTEFKSRPEYAINARNRNLDPLYWTPPGGESIAHVAENRVRNVLDTLHREVPGGRVLMVTHGEMMMAFRLTMERMSDERYEAVDADPEHRLPNCAVLHYSRIGPGTHPAGAVDPLRWLRRGAPVEVGEPINGVPVFEMHMGEWERIEPMVYDNDALTDW